MVIAQAPTISHQLLASKPAEARLRFCATRTKTWTLKVKIMEIDALDGLDLSKTIVKCWENHWLMEMIMDN